MKNICELRELAPDPVAVVNPATAGKYGLKDSDWVSSATRRCRVRVTATDDILPGVVSVLHGWFDHLNENVLTDVGQRDPVTGYPELWAIACRLAKT
ncbi:MAG: molybdopterin dinucleotide binding domain-containing protein [Syntrophorhabdales bacterium]|jgi:anaerobic selenocysteine-containing dehydrogenase